MADPLDLGSIKTALDNALDAFRTATAQTIDTRDASGMVKTIIGLNGDISTDYGVADAALRFRHDAMIRAALEYRVQFVAALAQAVALVRA